MQAVDSPPMPQGAKLWPLSIAAYHTLAEAGLIPENTELLYGFVYKKMSKSPLHSALVRRLTRLLKAACPPGFFIDSEQPITCDDSEPEPDIALIKGSEEEFWECHPTTAELVVEVCVTSHDYDRMKLAAYAKAGVKECWFVLGPERQIEVFRAPQDGNFGERKTYTGDDLLTCAAVPNFSLKVEELFEA